MMRWQGGIKAFQEEFDEGAVEAIDFTELVEHVLGVGLDYELGGI